MLNKILIKVFRFFSRLLQLSGIADFSIRGKRVRSHVSTLLLPLVVRNIANPAIIKGFKFHHGGSVSRSVYSYVSTEYEPATYSLVKTVLKPGDIFYDAGAHIGYFSVIAAAAVGPEGHVYAFEPSDETARYLRETVESNGMTDTITVVEEAVAGEVGTLSFEGSDVGSTARKIVRDGDQDQVTQIRATTLDAHWQKHCNRPVKLLKIDVEGYEFVSLSHSLKMFEASPECIVTFETRTHGEISRKRHDEIMALLAGRDFTHAYVLHDDRPVEEIAIDAVPVTGKFGYLNIAVSKGPLNLTSVN